MQLLNVDIKGGQTGTILMDGLLVRTYDHDGSLAIISHKYDTLSVTPFERVLLYDVVGAKKHTGIFIGDPDDTLRRYISSCTTLDTVFDDERGIYLSTRKLITETKNSQFQAGDTDYMNCMDFEYDTLVSSLIRYFGKYDFSGDEIRLIVKDLLKKTDFIHLLHLK